MDARVVAITDPGMVLPQWAEGWHMPELQSVKKNPGEMRVLPASERHEGVPLFIAIEHALASSLSGSQLWTNNPIVVPPDTLMRHFLTLGHLLYLQEHPDRIPGALAKKRLFGLASACRHQDMMHRKWYFDVPELCPHGASWCIAWTATTEVFDPRYYAIPERVGMAS